MNIPEIQTLLQENSKDTTNEFKRLFHGRGGLYEGWNFLTVDSMDRVLSVALYSQMQDALEAKLIEMLKNFIVKSRYAVLVLQRRYLQGTPSEIIVGELEKELFVVENGLKIKLNLLSNQNSGYFPDMKNGRKFIKENAQEKNVLNLFSYTCAFSLFAIEGGALSVLNVDMNKSALTRGRENHRLNNLDTKKVSFLPYNILKSFSGIRKKGPFDLIIIDPPTFQKGSFEASKDYTKIIQKLPQLASENAIILACLNAPDLDAHFLIELFKEFAPDFKFLDRLDNVAEFASADEDKSLKNLVFKRDI
ncbi:class I SAM-dependent methyltransferase [bacterium]|nr:class I SAM-dependent methyltransferase [bacterium]MBU1994032.1 class I SAM-dependent methyltransferase [bacterium]